MKNAFVLGAIVALVVAIGAFVVQPRVEQAAVRRVVAERGCVDTGLRTEAELTRLDPPSKKLGKVRWSVRACGQDLNVTSTTQLFVLASAVVE